MSCPDAGITVAVTEEVPPMAAEVGEMEIDATVPQVKVPDVAVVEPDSVRVNVTLPLLEHRKLVVSVEEMVDAAVYESVVVPTPPMLSPLVLLADVK